MRQGRVAQWLEHRIHKPAVVGSIPTPATTSQQARFSRGWWVVMRAGESNIFGPADCGGERGSRAFVSYERSELETKDM